MIKSISILMIVLSFSLHSSASDNERNNHFNRAFRVIKKEIKNRNLTIFSITKHHRNAKKVGLEQPFNTIITFGNPKVGTLLMQENPLIGIDLPLRIQLVDIKGSLQVFYPDPKAMAKRYDIQNAQLIQKIENLLMELKKSVQ
jgi:uncharacterized protein (DUF302 family)